MLCKDCGKDKELHAKGLCRSCYQREYRKIRKTTAKLCIDCGKYPIKKNRSKYYCGWCLAKRKGKMKGKRAKVKKIIEKREAEKKKTDKLMKDLGIID